MKIHIILLTAVIAISLTGCETIREDDLAFVDYENRRTSKISDAEIRLKQSKIDAAVNMEQSLLDAELNKKSKQLEIDMIDPSVKQKYKEDELAFERENRLKEAELRVREAELELKIDQMKLEQERNKPKLIRTVGLNDIIFSISSNNQDNEINSKIKKKLLSSGFIYNNSNEFNIEGKIFVDISYDVNTSHKDTVSGYSVYEASGSVEFTVIGKDNNYLYASDDIFAIGERKLSADAAEKSSLIALSDKISDWSLSIAQQLFKEYQSKLRMDQMTY